MARRKQCKKKGCRKSQAEGSEFCELHMTEAEPSGGNGVGQPEVVFPEDEVLKLTDAELTKVNHLALQMNFNLQQIRVLELEQERADRAYVADKHTRDQHIRTLREQVDPLENNYKSFAVGLARKYKIRPEYFGFDDETGVIRDHTPQEEVEPG